MVAELETDKTSLQRELAEAQAEIHALAEANKGIRFLDGDQGQKPDTYRDLPNGSLVTATVQLFSCGSCGFSFNAIHCDEEQDVDVGDRTWTCPLCFPDTVLPLAGLW